MQATARMASVVSSTLPARRRLIRDVRPTSMHLSPMAPSVESFVECAREFCSLAEASRTFGASELWRVRSVLLQLLYHMPAIETSPQAAEHDGLRPDDDTYRRISTRFAAAPFNFYRVVFDPHDFDATDEPVTGMLSDDLGDIYRDLSQGLSSADSGHLEDACFEWTLSYRTHWARHAVQALSAIETFRLERYVPEP